MSTPATTPPLVTRADIEGIRRADFYALVKKLTSGAALTTKEQARLEGYLVQFGEADGAKLPPSDKPPAESMALDAGGKATREAKQVRIQWLALKVACRVTGPELVQIASENWRISGRAARQYIAAAEKLIADSRTDTDKRKLKALARSTLDKAIAGAMADRDWSAVAKLLEREAKLFGLDAAVVQEVRVAGADDKPLAILDLPGGKLSEGEPD